VSDVTVSYRVSFRKREGSALVATTRPEARPEVAAAPVATARDARPHAATDATPTARLLALANRVERLVESGELRDYREAATRLGISHARMSQIMALLLLPTSVQADVLLGRRHDSECALRAIAIHPAWPSSS
jgi:hypothetical protein